MRPAGVAARDGVLYVADPGVPALWILDSRAGRSRRVDRTPAGSRWSRRWRWRWRPVVRSSSPTPPWPACSASTAPAAPVATVADPGLRRPAGLAYDAAPRSPVRGGQRRAPRSSSSPATASRSARSAAGARRRGNSTSPRTSRWRRTARCWSPTPSATGSSASRPTGGRPATSGVTATRPGTSPAPRASPSTAKATSTSWRRSSTRSRSSIGPGQYLLGFGERGVGRGQFWLPGGLFIDPQDRIYVGDAYNRRVQVFQYLRGDGDDAG